MGIQGAGAVNFFTLDFSVRCAIIPIDALPRQGYFPDGMPRYRRRKVSRFCRYSSSVERQLPKLERRVRFPLSASCYQPEFLIFSRSSGIFSFRESIIILFTHVYTLSKSQYLRFIYYPVIVQFPCCRSGQNSSFSML